MIFPTPHRYFCGAFSGPIVPSNSRWKIDLRFHLMPRNRKLSAVETRENSGKQRRKIWEDWSMAGKFTFIIETDHTTLDWGRVGALCNPSGTGAKQLVILDGRLFPGKGHDFHKHPNQEEVILVVSGQIEQWIDKDKRVLGPGDSAFIPADTVHASFNIGEGEANIIAIFGPAVGADGFETTEMSAEAPWNSLRPSPTPKE